jgi:hypothetical protein
MSIMSTAFGNARGGDSEPVERLSTKSGSSWDVIFAVVTGKGDLFDINSYVTEE